MENIDIAIIGLFIFATLIAGFTHGSKIKNLKEYALGGRNFSTAALVSTIVATWASGSGFFITLSNTYKDGLYYLIASTMSYLSLVIVGVVFIPRMKIFLGDISIAESMGKLYGKQVRIITAFCGIMAASGFIAVQFKIFGRVVGYFIGVPIELTICFVGIITTLYSAYGGIKAVTYTDVIQFFTIGLTIPLIGVMVWNHLYYNQISVFETIGQNPKFDYTQVVSFYNNDFLMAIPLMLYFLIPNFNPVMSQRILMGNDLKQVKKAFYIAAAILVVIKLVTAWIPFLLFSINPNLNSQELLGYLINNFTFIGFKALVIISVIAMAMSTADSNINTSSVLFSNDICKPLNLFDTNSLLTARLFALALGTMSIILALSEHDLLSIILTANSFYIPVITAPLLLAILGFKTSTKSVLISMFAGFCTVIVWWTLQIKTNAIIPGLVVNLIFLMGSHYLLNQEGGWNKIKEEPHGNNLRKQLKTSYSIEVILANVISLFKSQIPKNPFAYMGLGIYFIIYSFTAMYSTNVELVKSDNTTILVIYQIMMVSGVVMSLYPLWPLSIKDHYKKTFVRIWWFISIFYMLIVFSSLLVMVSDFGSLQFAIFTANLIVAIILIGWKLSLFLIPIGFYLAIDLYKMFNNTEIIDLSIGSPLSVLMYVLILVSAILVIFLKPKQEYVEETEAKVETLEFDLKHLDSEVTNLNEQVTDYTQKVEHYSERVSDQQKEINRLGLTSEKILNNVNHELRLPVGNVMNFAEMLSEGLDSYPKEYLKELSDEVYKNSNRLSTMILNMLDLATLDVKKVDLQKKMVNFSELVEDRVKTCRKIYLQGKPINFRMTIDQNVLINIDPNYIRQTVDNLVINAINFSQKGTIAITVRKQTHTVIFTITDQGIGIPEKDKYDVFNPFRMASNTESKAEGRGVGLTLCKSAVNAHEGEINVDIRNGTTFRFALPFETEG